MSLFKHENISGVNIIIDERGKVFYIKIFTFLCFCLTLPRDNIKAMAGTGSNDIHMITEEEFGKLFKSSRELFIRIANSYVHDYSVAEDITNDSFIRLWEKRGDVRTDNYRSYAFKIIINKCLDWLKSQQVRSSARQDMGETMQRMQIYEIASLRGCNPDKIFEAEIEEIFRETVDRLPEMAREVFTASRFRGKTYSEIAEDYGLSVRQVTSHMQYALKVLRLALKDYISSR